jgi:hypothetical protein
MNLRINRKAMPSGYAELNPALGHEGRQSIYPLLLSDQVVISGFE